MSGNCLFPIAKPTERKSSEQAEQQNRRGNSIEEDRALLQFNDHVALDELYTNWEPYNHPVYGEIEIGGWVKMSSRLPHPFMLPDLVHRNAMAVLFSAEQTPEISLEVFENEKISKDLYRIRVRLKNDKAIPSMSYQAVKNKAYPQDILTVTGSSVEVVAGGQIQDKYMDKVSYKEHKPEVQFLQVPGFGTVEYEFLIKGKGKV